VPVILFAGVAWASSPAVTTTSLPASEKGLPYSATLTAGGGTPPYSHWTVVSGSLASGLTLNAATGVISGTAASASGPFTVSVQDSLGSVSAASASLTIASITPVSITTLFLPGATTGAAYSQTLTATGGVTPYSNWTVSSGSLPPGLTLGASTGIIAGTPTSATASPYRFNVSVQDSNGATAVANEEIAVRTSSPATATGLTGSANPARYGQSVTLTATVTPSAATGNVTFYDGATYLGQAALSGGTATFSTAALNTGARLLRARYGGSGAYAPSLSSAFGETVASTPASGFTVGASVSFPAYVPLPASVAADVNGDGKPDLIVVPEGARPITALGNGDGTFQTPVASTTNAACGLSMSLVVADFNGDGKPDLAVGCQVYGTDGSAMIYLGNGDGTFTFLATYYLPGGGSNGVLQGSDLNGDGNADLVYVGGVLLGNGDGTFGYGPANAMTNLDPFALGDLNGDGIPDLVFSPGSSLQVALGNGDGSFGAAVTYTGATGLIVIADFNGDGKPDVASTSSGNTVVLRLGNGDGTLQSAVSYPFGGSSTANPISLLAVDVDGNGTTDLVVSDSANNQIAVLPGNGNGTFGTVLSYAPAASLSSLAAADFNGDNRVDFALTGVNPTVVILGKAVTVTAPVVTTVSLPASEKTLPYSATLTAAGGTPPYSHWTIVSGSLASGLTLNAATGAIGGTTSSASGPFTVSVQDSTGAISVPSASLTIASIAPVSITTLFLPRATVGTAYSQTAAATAGTPPYSNWSVSSGALPPGLTLSASTGTISGTPASAAGSPYRFNLSVQDANGATAVANLEIAVQLASPATTTSLTTSANSARYGQAVTLTATVTPAATGKVTFYDGGAFLGQATLSGGTATLSTISLNTGTRLLRARFDGSGAYAPSLSPVFSETVASVSASGFTVGASVPVGSWVAADVNGDGKSDLVSVSSVALGNGDGTFQTPVASGTGGACGTNTSLVVADFNGDGKPDLAIGCQGYGTDGSARIYLGNGDGTFTFLVTYYLPGGGTDGILQTADLNGDGNADLAYVGGVLLGNGDGTFGYGPANSLINLDPFALGDLNGDGIPDLVSSTGGNLQVAPGNGDGSFGTPVNYTGAAGQFVIADFNGDGKPDVAGTSSGNTVIVRLGNGDGTLQSAVSYPFGGSSAANPISLLAVDVDGNGTTDLVVSDAANSQIAVLPGNGNGAFGAAMSYAPAASVYSLAAADFNGDNRVDFALTRVNPTTIILGKAVALSAPVVTTASLPESEKTLPYSATLTAAGGTPPYSHWAIVSGTLASGLTLNAATGVISGTANAPSGPFTVSVQDSLADVSAASASLSIASITPVSISTLFLPGATTGTAYSQALAATGGVTPYTNWTVSSGSLPPGLALNATTGTIAGTPTSAAGTPYRFNVSVQDSNGATAAANEEIAVQTSSPATTTVLTSSTNPARYGQTVTLTATVAPSAATGKATFYDGTAFVGEGTLSGGVATFSTSALNTGTRQLEARYDGSGGYAPSLSPAFSEAVASTSASGFTAGSSAPFAASMAADVNGDGKPDLITVSDSLPVVTVALGNGDGAFQAPLTSGANAGCSPSTTLAVGDFNGDGKLDLAKGCLGFGVDGSATIYLGNGDGTFTYLTNYYLPGGGVDGVLKTADVNVDGNADLLYTGGVLLGNGDGTFAYGPANTLTALYPFVTGDLNGDGIPDLVSAQGANLVVMLGNGDGSFRSPLSYAGAASKIAIADFNGDGKLDVAGTSSGNTVFVRLGNGDGTLQAAVSYPAGGSSPSNPGSLLAVDVDGNGTTDLVVSDSANNQIAVLPGNGNGTFATTVSYAPTASLSSLAAADFNGDNRVDFALTGVNPTVVILGKAIPAGGGTPPSGGGSGTGGGVIVPTSSLAAAPTAVSFTAGPSALTGSATVTISNSGPSASFSTSYSTNAGVGWLSISPTTGTIAAQQVFTVSYNAASLSPGSYSGTVSVSTATGLVSMPVSLTVPTLISAAPQSLSFAYQIGGPAPPAQSLSIAGVPAGLAFSVSVSGGAWLSVVSSSGTAPAAVSVSVSPAALSAGTYSATVAITAAGASTVAVPVTLVVQSALPPKLSVLPASLAVTLPPASSTTGQVVVSNAGGGTLQYSAQAASGSGSWLSLASGASGNASGSAPALVLYQVNTAGMAPGIYNGGVTVTDGSGNSSTSTIVLTVTPAAPVLSVSQTGLTFNAVSGSGNPPSQKFSVLNTGTGSANWTATVSTASGGSWLSIGPSSGAASTGQAGSPVTVTASPAGLAAGQYYGSVAVSSPGASNTQSITVLLNVGAAGSTSGIAVSSGAAVLVGAAGSSATQSSSISVFNPNSAALAYTSSVTTAGEAGWLTVSPSSGSFSSGANTLTLQANDALLAPGVQSGTVTLTFSGGMTATVTAVAIATGGNSSSAHFSGSPNAIQSACAGGKATYTVLAIAQPLSSASAQPGVAQPVRALLFDDCGNPVSSNAAVTLSFAGTGASVDPASALQSTGNGVWEGTWVPEYPSSAETLTVSASATGLQPSAAQIPVSSGPLNPTGAGAPTGVVNAAREAAATPQVVSPGEYIAIYGSQFAAGAPVVANTAPFTASLNGIQVFIGNQPAPLYYAAPGQIDALVPINLAPGAADQLVIARGTTLSVPVSLSVASYDPGIYTADASGSGQGAVEIAGTSLIAGPGGANSRPVQSGSEDLAVFATGLGPVAGPNGETAPADGAAAPSSILYRTKAAVSATLGGVAVPVTFSGLTPSAVSLYQVNIQVPSGVPTGSAVPLVLTVTDPVSGSNYTSNPVTVAVR
jgi:hypothetical protein